MNISPVTNSSFKGFINIYNKNGDNEKKAKFYEYNDSSLDAQEIEISKDKPFELKGKKGNHYSACYSDEHMTSINTDYIERITPRSIVVRGGIDGQFGIVNINGQHYGSILKTYTAAAQNEKLSVDVYH